MKTILATGILALAITAGASPLNAQAPRVIAIGGTDSLAFSLPNITAKPGESLRIVLSTKSMQPKTTMAHNFVLLAAGTDTPAFAMMAAMARATEYIPAALKGKVLAATRLAGAGETVSVDFKAPTKPGIYPYLCTFPGHVSGGMRGTLTVR